MMNLMTASVAIDFFHHRILVAYDMRVRFVTMVTIWLLDWRCLRSFWMVQPIVMLVVRSRLWLLTGLSKVLLVSVTAATRMIFVRIFSLKIGDDTAVVSKFADSALGGTVTRRPNMGSPELSVQVIQRTHSGDLSLIGIRIGWCHNIMIVIANVNNRWIGITVFVERDLCVTTGGRKLGISEQVRSRTTRDGGLRWVQPLDAVRSQTPTADIVHNVRVNVIDIVRYTIACIGFKLPRSELNTLTIVNAITVADVAIVTTTAIVCTEGAGRIEQSGSVMVQTTAYGIRLDMLSLHLLLLLLMLLLL